MYVCTYRRLLSLDQVAGWLAVMWEARKEGREGKGRAGQRKKERETQACQVRVGVYVRLVCSVCSV